jgi:hypothetical protein
MDVDDSRCDLPNTLPDESFISVTISNLSDGDVEFPAPWDAIVFGGPMTWTIPAPSGFVFNTPSGSSRLTGS